MEALGLLRDSRSRELFQSELNASHLDTRLAAATGLARLDVTDPRLWDFLIKALGAADAAERLGAVKIMGMLNDPRAVEPLVKTLNDRVDWVVQAAADALGTLRFEITTESLIKLLNDQNQYDSSRCAAADIFAMLADARAVVPLLNALEDKSRSVRCSAAAALNRLDDLVANKAKVRAHVLKVLKQVQNEAASEYNESLREEYMGMEDHRRRLYIETKHISQVIDESEQRRDEGTKRN